MQERPEINGELEAESRRHDTIRPGNCELGSQVNAIETVRGVLTDLTELAERLPVPPDQAAATARILGRLAEEITEAAGMIQATAHGVSADRGR